MTLQKDHNNFPVTNLKDINICNLSDKEIKIAVLRKLNILQKKKKKTHRKTNKIKETIDEQNEKFNRDIEIMKRD